VAERPVVLPPVRERAMSITEFLDGYNPDPETKRVMGIAFEMARVALEREWAIMTTQLSPSESSTLRRAASAIPTYFAIGRWMISVRSKVLACDP